MIRRDGETKKWVALVRYAADDMEQWETIGVAPFRHKLLAEPAEPWTRAGTEHIGARVWCEGLGGGTVICWLPASADEPAFFRVLYDDLDFNDLGADELAAAIEAAEARA